MPESLQALAGVSRLLSDGIRSLSAAEVMARVATMRTWLRRHGGSRYALLADNGLDWVITDLALLELRRCNVPLPGYFTARQLEHVVTDAGIDHFLTDQPERLHREMPDLELLAESPEGRLTLFARTPVEPPAPAPAGTVKVTYTSGSTGKPKGVCLGAEGQLRVARTLASLSAKLKIERHLCLLPLPTLLENLAGVYAPLLAGAECIVPSLEKTGMSYGDLKPHRILAAIARHRPSSLILVPELLKLLVTAAEQGWIPPDTLRFIAVGGASVPRDLLARAQAAGLPAYEGYGLTECTSVVSLSLPGQSRLGSAGRPLPHVSVRIDAHGQIHVRGTLLLGLLGSAAPPPEEVATGDLGELDADGYLYVRGRQRNLFVTSFGRNLSPEWIESALLENPAIARAVVWGEGLPHPHAVLCPTRPELPDSILEAAVQEANRALPDYARIGQWVRADQPFTHAEGLLTANGRPRREAILARYSSERTVIP